MFTNDGWENRFNYQYHGDVYMGSELQQLKVVWDTGSGAFICNSMLYEGWDDISTRAFDKDASTSHTWKEPEET